MDHTTDKIHVMPDESDWNIEDQEGLLLGHSSSRPDAIEQARKAARQRGINTVVVHDGDGVTEEVSL